MAEVGMEEVLDIHPRGVRMTCSGLSRIGKMKRFRDCANPISKSDRALAQQFLQTLSMLDLMERGIDDPPVVHVIDSLATCTLCAGVHRKKEEQIATVKQKFTQRIQDYVAERQGGDEPPRVVPLQEVPAAHMNREPAPRVRQLASAAAAPLRLAPVRHHRPAPAVQRQAPVAPQPPINNPPQRPPVNRERVRRFQEIFPAFQYVNDPELAEVLLDGYDEERIAQQEIRDNEMAQRIDHDEREAVDRARVEADRVRGEEIVVERARAAEVRQQREAEAARAQADEARAEAEARQLHGEEAARNMAGALQAEARRLREVSAARNQANAHRAEQARAEIFREARNPAPARQEMAQPAQPARLFVPPRSRGEVRRQPINEDCYICYEAINREEDAVWCKGECGKNVHRACFEQWRVIREFRGVVVCCAHCRAPWVAN